MKVSHLTFFAIALTCKFAQSAEQLTSITIQVPVAYANESDIPPKVVAECSQLRKITGQFIVDVLKEKKYAAPVVVDEVNEASIGLALKTEIIGITATPGGGWSGGKTMTTKTQLFQDGILVDSVVRSRSSKGGLFGAVQGNCDILARDAEALAADTYVWLVKLTKSKTLPAQLIATAATTSEADASGNSSNNASSPLSNGKSLFIRTPAHYAENSGIRREILDECHLDSTLSNYALEIFGQKISNSTELTANSNTENKDVIEFSILKAQGDAGGTASGSKSMTIRTVLLRNGEIVAQHENTESGGGAGMFGPMKGTCTILAAVARNLAADAAKWYSTRTPVDVNAKPAPVESN